MGYGAFTVVWPYDDVSEIWSYTYLYMEKCGKRKKLVFLFFYFSRPRALWAFYFIIHIKHRNQRGDCYLNSIRKSWLLDPLHFAHLDHLPTDPRSWFQKFVCAKKKLKKLNKRICFKTFFLFLKCQWHPQRLEVLQYQGHVRPGSGASTAGPQPWLKQFT